MLLPKLLSSTLLGSGQNFSVMISSAQVLQAGIINNRYTYRRNDGVSLNNISLSGLSANLYPIAYCWEILGGVPI